MTLQEIRKHKRVTSIEAARQLGISQGYYSLLENGKRPFSYDQIKILSRVVGTPIDVLRSMLTSFKNESFYRKHWVSQIRIQEMPLEVWLAHGKRNPLPTSKLEFKYALGKMLSHTIDEELALAFRKDADLLEFLFELSKKHNESKQ